MIASWLTIHTRKGEYRNPLHMSSEERGNQAHQFDEFLLAQAELRDQINPHFAYLHGREPRLQFDINTKRNNHVLKWT